jgi:hypothetical protein
MVETVGRLVGAEGKALALVAALERRIAEAQAAGEAMVVARRDVGRACSSRNGASR